MLSVIASTVVLVETPSRAGVIAKSKSNIANNLLPDPVSVVRCGIDCIDIQAMPPHSYGGPTFPLGPLLFTNPTSGGVPSTIDIVDRPEAHDGNPEMYIGFSKISAGRTPLLVTFPAAKFPRGVCSVVVDVQHWASPLTVEALNSAGVVVASATQTAQKKRVKLLLRAPGIHALRFKAVEAHLYGICWTSV
jgi:hypothetical protein